MTKKNSASVGFSDVEVKTFASEVNWFAGLAMQAMITKQGIPESQSAREEIALWSFRMAQSMVTIGKQLQVADSRGDLDPEC